MDYKILLLFFSIFFSYLIIFTLIQAFGFAAYIAELWMLFTGLS